MTDVTVRWVLPTTRESGKPLVVTDIDRVVIEMSADGGVNYVGIDEFPSSVLETVVVELEPGEWFFKGYVRDTKGRKSQPVVRSKVIEDPTPPSALVELTLV